ncbi:MAG: TonB-dependent receptor [Candidatus Omnitrophota bacterium]
MLKKKCGLFFVIVISLSYFGISFCSADVNLEPIVITKSQIHLSHPYSLEKNILENLPSDSPIEALSFSPLDLQSRSLKGGVQTDFSLRGSTYQGVLVLIDGQRVNDPKLGHYNSDLPLTREDIQRIEVIPGVGSSLFGPDAIGGAINIILKKPQDKRRVLEFKGGQYKTWSGLFSISDKIKDLGVRFSVENQESAGFSEDTDFNKFITTFASSLEVPDGSFDLNWGYLEKEFGAYDFYTPGLGYPSKEWIRAYHLNTGFTLDKEGLIIKPNFLWRRHYDKFMLDKTLIRSRSLNHHRSDVYTPNIYFQKGTETLGRIGLGLEYGEERINSTVLGKHNRAHKSMFIDNSKDLTPRLSLGLSARTDDYDGFDQAYTGSLNFRYKVSEKNSLHFGVSRSIRIPTFHELHYDDLKTTGNAALSCERSLNYESGLDYKKERFSTGTTFFLRQEEDSIDWIKRTPTQAKWQAENITEAQVFGIENYLKLKINPNLTLDSNYTYINKRINDRGYLYKYGPNYIKHLINNMFSFNLPFGVQTIELTYKKKPSRRGWLLLNSRLAYNLPKKSQIFLEITNLLNVEYQEIEGIPQPGRWVEGGFRLEW